MDKKALSQTLKSKKLIPEATLLKMEKEAAGNAKSGISWEQFLLDKKAITEEKLLAAESEILAVPVVDLRDQTITQETLNLVPEPIAPPPGD